MELAQDLNLEPSAFNSAPEDEWYLGCVRDELALCHATQPALIVSERSIRHKISDASNTNLAKACSAARGKKVLDAFGGWGVDGFALSTLGCEVTVLEANPLICSVARYLARELGSNATVVCAEAARYLTSTPQKFDVVYFDPMFPPHPKTAKPVRRMQVLEQLAWRDTDFDLVFDLAKRRTTDRIVVKARRTIPPKIPRPDWRVGGKTVRFDVYRVAQI